VRTRQSESKRARAIELLRQGVETSAVAERTGASRSAVKLWARQAGLREVEVTWFSRKPQQAKTA
jgi:transposase